MKRITKLAVNFEKFNKKVKPFTYRGKHSKYRRVSCVFYKDVTDYLFDLHERLAKASDLTDFEEEK